MRIIGLLVLHAIGLYLLRLLWKDRNAAIQRGGVLTRMGDVSNKEIAAPVFLLRLGGFCDAGNSVRRADRLFDPAAGSISYCFLLK